VTCPRTVALGAYVLGALEREERSGLEGHLEMCGICRDELDRLAPLPGLLSRLSAEEAGRLLEPAFAEDPRPLGMAESLLDDNARPVGTAEPGPDDAPRAEPPPAALTAAESDARTGVQASAELSGQPWGTRVQLQLTGVRPGMRCRLVARAVAGRSEIAATWRATYLGTADVPGAVAIRPERLLALDVVDADDRVLVRMPVSRR
jgi:Putative zinc-finger